jgi:hypothetical protein
MTTGYLILLGLSSVVLLWCLTLVIVASARGRNISKCPRCHSRRVQSSRSTLGDELLLLIDIRPYDCEACKKRFYAIRRKHEPKSRRAAGGSIH